jgi:hypothetical protein
MSSTVVMALFQMILRFPSRVFTLVLEYPHLICVCILTVHQDMSPEFLLVGSSKEFERKALNLLHRYLESPFQLHWLHLT